MTLNAGISATAGRATRDAPVRIPPHGLDGILTVPGGAKAIVIFAHGSGSSRLSPRNTHVATELQRVGLATLLFDLLTEREAENRANVFDIALLGQRLLAASAWVADDPRTAALVQGFFGASTGAAAALVAAARGERDIGAVVSRGGRPDLAFDSLSAVTAPTLLIVGERDEAVLDLNREAYARLAGERALRVVPGATHLFEEPGTLDAVIQLAAGWFAQHLQRRSAA